MKKTTKIILIAICVILMVSSIILSGPLSNPEVFKSSIDFLNEQDNKSRNMIAITAGSSLAVSLLPNDVGTPIANKLADIAGYFSIALGALFLEKYLMTIIALIVLRFVIPAGLLICIIALIINRSQLVTIGLRLVVMSVAIALVIPASVKISQMIDATYTASVDQDVEELDFNEYYQETQSAEPEEAVVPDSAAEDDRKWYEKAKDKISGVIDSGKEAVSNAVEKVSESVTEKTMEAKDLLEKALEKLAVTIVISCVIPVLVLIIMLYLVKFAFGLNIQPVDIVGSSMKKGVLPKQKLLKNAESDK